MELKKIDKNPLTLFNTKSKSESSASTATSIKRTRRINAFIVDLLFIQVFQKMAILAYLSFINQSLFSLPLSMKANLLGNISQMRDTTMFFTYFSYFLVASYLFEGKTIGKSIFNLRVVNKLERDGQIFFRDCLLRSVGYTLCYIMLFIPFLASAFGKEAKGLPDYLSETEVVTEEDFQQLLRDQEESQTLNKTEDRAINQLDLFAS